MTNNGHVDAMVGRIYWHYKGGRYLVDCLAETHHHNGDIDVIYISLTNGKYVTRPLRRDSRNEDSWTDPITWPDGKIRNRFTYVSEISDEDSAALQRLGPHQAAPL